MSDLEALCRSEATAAVAKEFGVTMRDIQESTRGNASEAMTKRLGFPNMSSAEDLAKAAGGAGILIGYILNMP